MPGKGQHRAEKRQHGEENDQVQDQGQHGVGAGEAVVNEHEEHDYDKAEDGGLNAVADGIRAERRANGAFFKILDGSGQRACTQDQREIVGGSPG